MNPDGDRAYFKAAPLRESAKAVLVRLESGGREIWIPRAVCEWHRDGILVVEQWFSDKERMQE